MKDDNLHTITGNDKINMNNSIVKDFGAKLSLTNPAESGMVDANGESIGYIPSKTYSLLRINKSNKLDANTSTLGDTTYTYIAQSSLGTSNTLVHPAAHADDRRALAREENKTSAIKPAYIVQSNTIMLDILCQKEGLDGFVEKLVDGRLSVITSPHDPIDINLSSLHCPQC